MCLQMKAGRKRAKQVWEGCFCDGLAGWSRVAWVGGWQIACLSILIFLEGQQMLKVVLILKEIALRLKESEVFVIIKKRKQTILVGPKCKITHGLCHTNSTTQFYISSTDPLLNIEVIFMQGSKRKLGGNTILNIIQWQPNVLHQTISALNNSPDKKARLTFSFYYFVDNSVNDPRDIFLCSDRFHDQFQTLQQKNQQLLTENKQLERELNVEEKRNKSLLKLKERRQLDLDQKEKALREQLQICKKSITNSNQEYEYSKAMRNQLYKLAKSKGLLASKDQ